MKKEYIYAGVSIFLWSTTATVTKLLLGSLNSMQITLISSLLSTVFLLAVNIAKGTIRELKGFKLKDFAYTFLLGTIGIFIYHLCLYIGIDRMEASQAFIINYLWPIMTVVFACIILKEKMTVRKAIVLYRRCRGNLKRKSLEYFGKYLVGCGLLHYCRRGLRSFLDTQ